MEGYTLEDYKSNLFYRIRYIEGENAKASARLEFHNSVNLFFIYFIEGRARIHIENSVFEVKDGDVILLNPSEMFMLDIENGCYHRRIVLSANIRMLKSFPGDFSEVFSALYKRRAGSSNIISRETAEKYELGRLFRELLDSVHEREGLRLPLSMCKSVEIICRISKITEAQESTSANCITRDALVNRALGYISAHFSEDISVQDIADHFNVHRSYLLHRFKKQMGISLWNYVIKLRINKFNSLISENTSAEEVALRVGFTNYSNFFRLYKKNMDMTPQEFKKQFQGS